MSLSGEQISHVLNEYAEEARAIEKSLVQISFYMRGGAPLNIAQAMTSRQRRDALEQIEENMERTSKTGVMMH